MALASRICLGVWHLTLSNPGLATTMARHCALLVATFRRFRLYRNSIPWGASSEELVAMEYMEIGASWPWNLSTVPTRNPGNASLKDFTRAL